jgi:hypothetical protein
MNEMQMSFGGEIELDVEAQMGSGVAGVKPRMAINFGEEVRANGKGKEKSRYLGAVVEAIELNDYE